MRWMAELGLNAFDTLSPEDAADEARLKLGAIVELLDHLDDTDFLASVFGAVGIEPRIGSKRTIREHRDIG